MARHLSSPPLARSPDLAEGPEGGLIASAPAVRALWRLLQSAAAGARLALVTGEAGSGRTYWARLFHALSGGGPLITADCALLNPDLFESQLFGVARGAATGVAPHPGFVGRARGGVLVLDRIELLDPALQAKLLRFLDSGEVTPLGGTPEQAEMRVVAIYTADPSATPSAGSNTGGVPASLRADFYYRLSGLQFNLPPLRERPEDLAAFVTEFLRRAGKPASTAKPAVLMAMRNHPLPGNLRELEAVLTGALAKAGSRRLDLKHLPASYGAPWPAAWAGGGAGMEAPAPLSPARMQSLAEMERDHILRVLAAHGGNRSATARTLAISRKSLWERLLRWGVVPEAENEPEPESGTQTGPAPDAHGLPD